MSDAVPPQPPPAPSPEADAGPRAAAGAAPAPAARDDRGRHPLPTVSRTLQHRFSVVWLVPLLALLVGGVLVVRALLERGPQITISFRSAEGLEAGRTEVRYKEVVVGRVAKVRLSEDRQQVLADVGLDKGAASLAVADTRFWVVRPRIGTAGVSGLGTLFSGAYIGVDAGSSTESKSSFTGLEAPPFVLRGEPGRSFVLAADDLGALDVGSLVYYRRTRVGRVVGYALDPERDTLGVQVFIESPYESLVSTDTHFWNASGIDLTLDASGLTFNTQSLASVLVGGIAFAHPGNGPRGPRAPEGERFYLYANQKAALAAPDGVPLRVRMLFKQSLRGLAVGAPIDLLGVEIGTVRDIAVRYDPAAAAGRQFPIEVTADLFLARLGRVREQFAAPAAGTAASDPLFLKRLVDGGFRAQVRTGNLLTGQLYVALDFMPKQASVTLDAGANVPTLPTVPGALSELQPQIAEIITRIGKVKFDEIGAGVQATLKGATAATAGLQRTLAGADAAIGRLTPEAQQALAEVRKTLGSAQATLGALTGTVEGIEKNVVGAEAPLQRDASRTLVELQRAAQALRALGDYLQRHPESLLRGKPDDPDLSGGGRR